MIETEIDDIKEYMANQKKRVNQKTTEKKI